MVCEDCRKATTLEGHQKCKSYSGGSTHCDCQHRAAPAQSGPASITSTMQNTDPQLAIPFGELMTNDIGGSSDGAS